MPAPQSEEPSMATSKTRAPARKATKPAKRVSSAKRKPQTAAPGAQFPPLKAEEMGALLQVLKQHEKALRAHKGVFKVDVGYRWKDGLLTGEVALRVHVKEKKPIAALEAKDVLPKEMGGFPVDVIQSHIKLHRNTRRNPIVGGVETRNVNVTVNPLGTLGAVVFDAANNNAPMALSNHHVYVSTRPNGAAGEQANQPGNTNNADAIGIVARSNRALDCAVVTLNGVRPASTTIIDFAGGIKGVIDPVIGLRVTKSGRTTGTTRGMIEGVSADEFTVVPVPGQWQELSRPGDSGSIWLEQDSHASVGLHYAGEDETDTPAPADERAWAKRAARVAARLNINLRRKAILADTGTHGPALATFRDRLLLGWAGTGNLRLNFMQATDGLNFGNKVTLGDTSPDAPALTVFRSRYVVAWIGVGNRRLNVMQSGDGVTWTNKVILADASDSSPALAVFNNQLYIAWRGVGNNQLNVMRSSSGSTWTNKRTLGDTTTAGPGLVSFAGRLRLAWRGVGNNRLNIISSADGLSFSGKRTLADKTTSKPSLHVHGRRLFLAWQGVGNNRLNVLESGDGTTFVNKVILRETCIDGPVLATLGNDLVWGWTGTDAQHRLNTLLYDLRG
jgi:hypothetical protein